MENKNILEAGTKRLGLKVDRKKLALFEIYTQELLQWTGRINITGHRDRESIEIFHYLDSLSLFETGRINAGTSILDVGSGAGFPGLPLKIFEPSIEMTLLESSEKRSVFLRYLLRILDIHDVNVEVARAEDFAEEKKAEHSFHRILCRAVGSMVKVCTWTLPLLKPGGVFLFQKSRRVTKEIRDGQDAIKRLGLEIREVMPITVPFLDHPRYVVIIGKT